MMMTCPRCWGRRGPCDGCDGKGRVPDVLLSPSFTLAELLRSQHALAHGIPNAPTAIEIRRLRDLCTQLLQPMRDALGALVVTSGFRAPRLNAAVKGSATSAHVVGWAADVQPVVASREDAMAWLAGSGLAWDQAILEPSWVHVGLRRPVSGEQRRQLLRAEGGKFVRWEPPARLVEHDRCTAGRIA